MSELQVRHLIGNLSSLKTQQKTNLVDAINDVLRYVSAGRRLVGFGHYLLLTKEHSFKIQPEDFEKAFFYDTKEWKYFSKVLNEWTPLPVGWLKLNNIVRMPQELPKSPKIGETVGVLYDSTVLIWNGENWVAHQIRDTVGDEYVIQKIVEDKQIKSGSLLLTEAGWIYIFN